jgi:FAD binding domain in molybdopterin dehydrogenase
LFSCPRRCRRRIGRVPPSTVGPREWPSNNSAFFERIAPASKPTGGSIVTIEHLFCRRRHRRFRRAGQRGSSTRRADARQSSPDSDTSGKRQLVFGPLARMSDIAADARLQRDYSALSESLWRAASQQLRNRQAPNVQRKAALSIAWKIATTRQGPT